MPVAPTRTALRQSRQFLLRRPNLRQASTAAETASKAKDTASGPVSKASEGLTKVQSSAGSIATSAATKTRDALGRVGGRTGRVISFVESLIPPTVYYTRVGLELSKIVFQGQKMAPPSISQFSSYLQPVTNAMRNTNNFRSTFASAAKTYSPEHILSRVRNISRGEVITGAVIVAELLGFFTVGEMIGRRRIVGYAGKEEHEEH